MVWLLMLMRMVELQISGQIQLATFANPEGLTKAGKIFFKILETQVNLNLEHQETATGTGTVQAGFLEMSNVDLSEEFTEMIIAQRAFQSNTKIITTSDEILQELVNLKR